MFFSDLESGRQALIDADGIRILYTSCQATTKCRELENLIFTSTLIMRKCFPKSHLPVESLRSPFSFSLPASDFHIIDDGEGQGECHLEADSWNTTLNGDNSVTTQWFFWYSHVLFIHTLGSQCFMDYWNVLLSPMLWLGNSTLFIDITRVLPASGICGVVCLVTLRWCQQTVCYSRYITAN